MAKPRPWTVLPHEPLEKLEDNLWTVAGRLPHGGMNRRMSVVRLAGGRLVLHNAAPLAEPAMRELEAFGAPTVLVVPNGFHRLDVHAWKERYPRLCVVCPPESRLRVSKVVAGRAAGVDRAGLQEHPDLVQRSAVLGVPAAVHADPARGGGVETDDHAH